MNSFKVISIDWKSDTTFCLRVERPNVLIQAGQCFNVGIPGMGINREYSMYSSADAPWLEFLIRSVDDGLVSPRLSMLKSGDLVEVDGPYGEFCMLEENKGQKNLFICTGTGIAPFHSFVKTFEGLDYLVIHGIKSNLDKYDFLDYMSGSYISCISGGGGEFKGRVTDFIKVNPPKIEANIFVCGNRNMIVDVVEILLDQGISGDQIKTEVFF
jgi:ferredoxin/flavodoxin---NADP+ reductase